MIIEGLMTTRALSGAMHVAPMGPVVNPERTEWLLRPFQSSSTFANLHRLGYGVFHVTDNACMLAQAVLGQADHSPTKELANACFALQDCCEWFQLKIIEWDLREPRALARAEMVEHEFVRPFFGWNRAKHAVIEAAILSSRIGLISPEEVMLELDRLSVSVEKTAGPDESRGFAILREYVIRKVQESRDADPSASHAT